jgi:hypothetical protein
MKFQMFLYFIILMHTVLPSYSHYMFKHKGKVKRGNQLPASTASWQHGLQMFCNFYLVKMLKIQQPLKLVKKQAHIWNP